MDTSELDYDLPSELIAQHPPERRDASRLLVYDRSTGAVRHRGFAELPDELSGELAVVNDTRVVPARIRIERPKGEVLLLERSPKAVTASGSRSRARRAGSRRVNGSAPSSCSSTSARAAGGFGSRASRTARRRCLRTSPSRSRSGPLPDRLRGRGRLRRSTHRRAALHARAPRPARRRARDAPRRPRHLRPLTADTLEATSCTASATRSSRRHGSGSARAPRVLAVGTTSVRVLETVARTGELGVGRASSSRPGSSSAGSMRS